MNLSTITRHESAINVGGFEAIYFMFQKDVSSAKKQKINIDNRNVSIFGMLETADDTELLTLYYTPKSVDFKESSQISRNGKVYNNSLTARIPQDREEVAATLQAIKNNKVFIVFKDRNGKIKQIKNNRLTETIIINTNDNYSEISLSGQSKEKSKFLNQSDFDYFLDNFIELKTMTDSFEVTAIASGQSIKVFAEARALNNVITTQTVSLPIGTSKIRGRNITGIEKVTNSVIVNINKPLPKCLTIVLNSTLSKLTDNSLKQLTLLNFLHLQDTKSVITDAGLASVPNLIRLMVYNTNSVITDAGLALVPNLISLYVGYTNSVITNAGLAFVSELTNLFIQQTNSVITDAGLALVPNLKRLYVGYTNSVITNAGLASVPNLSELFLEYSNSVITNAGLALVNLLVAINTRKTTSVITNVSSIVKTIDVALSSNTAANNDSLMASIITGGATNGTLKMTGYTNAASLATLQARGWIVTT